MQIIVALLVFGVIVLFHEYGHFIVARKNGIAVDEFMIGMGPKLFSIKGKHTEYSIRLLPIGGACVMREDEAPVPGDDTAFNNKSVWARIAVIAAGPCFNFLMAFVCALILVGVSGYSSTQITSIVEASPAEAAGLEAGDTILEVDGSAMHTYTDFRMYLALKQGASCVMTIERDGEQLDVSITPRLEEDGVYRIGIYGGQTIKPTGAGIVVHAFYEVESNVMLIIRSLELMVRGKVSADEISGPVGMVSMIGDSYTEAAQYGLLVVVLTILDIVLFLSANLGVMNLLPIPALDGGRLLFLIIEAIRGKKIDPEKEGIVHLIGFALLMVLMALIFINDISHLVG